MKRHGLAWMATLATVPAAASGQSKPGPSVEAQAGSDALPPEGVRTIQDAIKALNARANDKSAPAQPLGDPAGFFGPDVYPAAAQRASEQGRSVVRIELDARGFPTGCTVITSSGSTALDEATCRIAQTKMQYAPARNGKGKPIASQYTLPVRWVLPTQTDTPPRSVDLSAGRAQISDVLIEFQVDESGKAASCKALRKPQDGSDPCDGFKPGAGEFPTGMADGRPVRSVLTMETIVWANRADKAEAKE